MDKQVENESKDNKVRHSGFGIASVILGLFGIIFLFLGPYLFSGAPMMDPGPVIIMFVCPLISSLLLGLILGAVGLSRKGQFFSRLGVGINGIGLLAAIISMLYSG